MEKPLIDWFTVVAQIVNFLILVGLLKYFLYDRIVGAMEERQKNLIARAEETQAKKQEAEAELQRYQAEMKKLDDEREQLRAKMREEIEQQRKEALRESREEVDLQRARWYEALQAETDEFARTIREQLASGVCRATRHVLQDLADTELEEHVARVFLNRLQNLSQEDAEKLRQALHGSENGLQIESAFPLSESMKQTIVERLQEVFPDDKQVDFHTDTTLLCGIQLDAAGYKIAWEADSYLTALQHELKDAISHRVPEKHHLVDEEESANGPLNVGGERVE